MVQRNWVLDLFLLLQLHTVHATATCYAPDGTAVTDTKYAPCIAILGEFSMCCRLNDTNPDQCYSNGLCYNDNEYWRDYCTDQTWSSPNCLSNTTCDAANGGSSNGTARLNICPDGSYCCGTNNDCCTPAGEFTLKATLVAMSSNSSSTAIITAGGSKVGEDRTVAVGAGVGVSLGVLALAMLGAGFLWGRRKRKATYEDFQQTVPEGQIGFVDPQLAGPYPVYEADGSSAPARSELPASK
ncbi:hypothetical protein BJX99DRAFT_228420 [Aspergillus californicus]